MIKNIWMILLVGLSFNTILAQNRLQVKVLTKETKETIFGASVLRKDFTTNYGAFILPKASLFIEFNNHFFLIRLKNSLILEQRNQSYKSVNVDKTLNSSGFETYLKLEYKDFTLLTNYAFNDVKLDENQKP
jgi:hypothetical protein